jgi:hypothetical protein
LVGDELLKADAPRKVEIAFDNVDSGLRLRGRLQRVVSQEADKNTAFASRRAASEPTLLVVVMASRCPP